MAQPEPGNEENGSNSETRETSQDLDTQLLRLAGHDETLDDYVLSDSPPQIAPALATPVPKSKISDATPANVATGALIVVSSPQLLQWDWRKGCVSPIRKCTDR